MQKNVGLTTALFSQQTGLALHAEPLPIPTTEMGEQSIPRRISTPVTTIPSRSKRIFPVDELDYTHLNEYKINDRWLW